MKATLERKVSDVIERRQPDKSYDKLKSSYRGLTLIEEKAFSGPTSIMYWM